MNSDITSVDLFILENCTLDGQGRNGTALSLDKIASAEIKSSSISSYTGGDADILPFLGDTKAKVGGAIIAFSSKVLISHCEIFNNSVTHGNAAGGAVYAFMSNFTLDNSVFRNNIVTGVTGRGGAVYMLLWKYFTINNSTFANNAVVSITTNGFIASGGAVYVQEAFPLSTLTLIYSATFINNSVSEDGGAVCVLAEFGRLIINISSFMNNTAVSKGGALYASGSIAVGDSMFNFNSVFDGGVGGGAIYSDFASHLIILASMFNYNRGGSEFDGALSIPTASEDKCSCNNHTNYGGAIYINSNNTVNITGSTFNSNVATESGNGGAVYANTSIIHLRDSTFNNNSGGGNGGAFCADTCHVTVSNSTFETNTVAACKSFDLGQGGAFYAEWSPSVIIDGSKFINNTVNTCGIGNGGAVHVYTSVITVSSCLFAYNVATVDGGAVYLEGYVNGSGSSSTSATFNNCDFEMNAVTNRDAVYQSGNGGAIYAQSGTTVMIYGSDFVSNEVAVTLGKGGAVYAKSRNITFSKSKFFKNMAVFGDGGAVYLFGIKTIYYSGDFDYGPGETFSTLISCTFINNSAPTGRGGALYLRTANVKSSGSLEIRNNLGGTGVIYGVQSTITFSENTIILNNTGSVFVFSCIILFTGYTEIVNNFPLNGMQFQEGGALTSIQSEMTFNDTTKLFRNNASSGGAILASESVLNLYGNVSISNNSASLSGGGIYAYQSELAMNGNVCIGGNTAQEKGGGVHVIGSNIKLKDGPRIFLVDNYAKNGGGMCLELNSKLYVVKTRPECSESNHLECEKDDAKWLRVEFSNNSAELGGALFVNDTTNSGTCFATPFGNVTTTSTECFFQNLGLHQYQEYDLHIQNTYFTNNFAQEAGSIVYGGILDRCTVSAFTEYFGLHSNSTRSELSATSYVASISNITNQDYNSRSTVSSEAVRLCFCRDGHQDCNYYPPPKYVRKGESFTVSLVAVDQVNNVVTDTIIHASVPIGAKLGEGQSIQQTYANGSCTELTYSVLSEHSSEQLYLYADGPCMDIGISKVIFTIIIAPCPIGFKDTNLHCECDPFLKDEYASDCFIDSETVERKDNTWFTHVNTTDHDSYIMHKHCPFDYCQPPSAKVHINLNTDNGSEALCAYNRSGKLCGSCKDGYSLCLGSSRCKPCSNNWLALLVVFLAAGVVLVAFLLECRLTVDTGTINSLIFYANIFATNRTIFFPSGSTSIFSTIFTIFIAWLNLDFGFETCFYDGLDSYAKAWLQFTFPLYVIVLVVVIIIVSDYSSKFAGLFTGKNPIATLATLILLSYTKLLRTIITSLSFTLLVYSDGSRELVWLIDDNVPYLKGKHIPLFIVAFIFLMLGLVYTFLLFSWQWIVNPKLRFLTWITKNTKVIAFMDAYHNQFNKDHRYWIGLLLLARVILYLVSAVNVLGDPRTNLLCISLTIAFLIFYQLAIVYVFGDKVHKNRLTYTFESISFLNLLGLTSVTFYITEGKTSQRVVSYLSISITFILFLVILARHACMYMFKKPIEKMCTRLRRGNKRCAASSNPPLAYYDDLEEESVSVTEIDASPVALDTDETVQHSDNVIEIHEGQEFASEVCFGIDAEKWNHDDEINSGCSPSWITQNTTVVNENSDDNEVELHTLTSTHSDPPSALVLNGPHSTQSLAILDTENTPLLV